MTAHRSSSAAHGTLSPSRLRGAMTALVTPFRADGKVDEAALRSLIERQLEAGITGLIPCGTTGETPTLNHDEIASVIRITVEAVRGRVPVIAGTGSNSTQKTIEATRLARELGADAALVVTPYYNKPGPKMLEAHYRAVAAEGGLPVVLYNVPGRTGINMSADTTLALAEVPGIVAIKEAAGDLAQVQAILAGLPAGSSFRVLSGDDNLALPMFAVGATGVISVASNVLPAEVSALWSAFERGDVAGAARQNLRLFPLFRALFVECNPVPAKVAMQQLGLCTDVVRMPLGPAQPATVELMKKVLTTLGAS
ncbi:MAG: 4-hydroxy-tetrahydrodipicolinate synthase [Myxococcales bacterium]|nr:4-hydroxy-tetrahydrodipicolinate synthase [Myxococcales bacterium]